MADGPELPQSSKSDRNISVLGVQALNSIVAAIKASFPQTGGTSTTATGGAITPPAQVVGYIVVELPNGTSAKVAYYA